MHQKRFFEETLKSCHEKGLEGLLAKTLKQVSRAETQLKLKELALESTGQELEKAKLD